METKNVSASKYRIWFACGLGLKTDYYTPRENQNICLGSHVKCKVTYISRDKKLKSHVYVTSDQ